LASGRATHKSDKLFGQWCVDEGFGDIPPRSRTDAIWLATNWSEIISDLSITHPNAIRAAHREAIADLPPTPELTIEAPTKLTAYIEQVAPVTKTINKLAAMAERGEGQEKLTAQRFPRCIHSTRPSFRGLNLIASAVHEISSQQFVRSDVDSRAPHWTFVIASAPALWA
jgi:hypothetical protein